MYLMPALHRGEKTYQALREQERNIKLTGGPVRLVPLDAQQEGWTQYGIETPGPMQEFEWAVQFAAPAKHPDRRLPLFRILVSLNQGKTWKQASLKGVQLDDGGAMQWSCGRLKITGENIRRLHVRVAVQARGVPETGIAKMEFFAHYRDPYAYRHPVLITHVFEETGQEYRPQAEAESGCTTKTYAVPLVNPDSDFIHNRCIEIAIP